jgi:hypothetical protein
LEKMRALPFLLTALLLPGCRSEPEAKGHQLPPLANIAETPGDWSALQQAIGRTPAESNFFEDSPVAVDIAATLGPDHASYRDAMMKAGPLRRSGPLLVSRAPDAWLVLQPADHSFRAALRTAKGWRQWQTAGADVPAPPGAGS